MNDNEIIELYFDRNEAAIAKTQEKYQGYCYSIAFNILHNENDAKECVNDAYLKTWNSIPPARPNLFSVYIGKITRNLAFDLYRKMNAAKRGGGEMEETLDELAECVSSGESVEGTIEKAELAREINAFLDTISKDQCNLFTMRYWYAMPIDEIANRTGLSSANVATKLSRIRKSLKEHLIKRGYTI